MNAINWTSKKEFIKSNGLDKWNSLTDYQRKYNESEYRINKLSYNEKIVFYNGFYDDNAGSDGTWINMYEYFTIYLNWPVDVTDRFINKTHKKIEKLFPEDEEWD